MAHRRKQETLDILKTTIFINARTLRANPAAVYHLIDFYIEHPERRSELDSGAALARVQAAPAA